MHRNQNDESERVPSESFLIQKERSKVSSKNQEAPHDLAVEHAHTQTLAFLFLTAPSSGGRGGRVVRLRESGPPPLLLRAAAAAVR